MRDPLLVALQAFVVATKCCERVSRWKSHGELLDNLMKQENKKSLDYFGKTVCGPIGVVLLFFLQFLWWLASPSDLAPLWSLYLLLSMSFLVCAAIYGIMRSQAESRSILAPIEVSQYSVYGSQIILIVDPRVEFIHGMIVLIYFRGAKERAESLIAYGVAQSVSSGGYFQIEVMNFLVAGIGLEDFVARRLHPHELLIKPYVTKDILG